MNKKITALFTASAMVLSALPLTGFSVLTADAADKNYITLSTQYDYDFESGLLGVEVDMTKNDGYTSGNFDINWDSDAFTLVSVDVEEEYCVKNIGEVETEMQPNYYSLDLDEYVNGNMQTGKVATFYFEKEDGYDFGSDYDFTVDCCYFSYRPKGGTSKTCSVNESSVNVPAKTMYDMRISAENVMASYTSDAEVRVPVVLDQKRSSGFIAGNLKASWNNSLLKLVGVEYNEDVVPSLYPADVSENNKLSSYKISFGDLLAHSDIKITSPAVIATLVFKPLVTTESDINITMSAADIVNYDLDQVNCKAESGTVSLCKTAVLSSDGTLTLLGNVDRSHVTAYSGSNSVRKVVCAEGTVFPADCSALFKNFKNTREFDLRNADTSQVVNMSQMFYNCPRAGKFSLSGFDTANVTDMSHMFEYCEAVSELDLSSFDTGKVTNMREMFADDVLLKNIYVSDKWDVSEVSSELSASMFRGCSSIRGGYTMSYVSSKVDKTCACVDTIDHHGYLSYFKLDTAFIHNCEFSNNIALYYAVPQDDLAGYTDLRLEVFKDQYEGGNEVPVSKKTVLRNYSESVINGKKYYMFSYKGITSTDMSSRLNASLIAEKDGRNYATRYDAYSIEDYAASRLEKSNNTGFKKLLVDMLNYGAAAQIHFNKNVNCLPNRWLTNEQKALATQTLPTLKSCEKTVTCSGATAKFAGKNLSFDNNITLMYRMEFAGNQNMKNVKLVLKYTTSKGVSVTKTIPASKFTSDKGYYIANFDSLAVTDLRSKISAKIYDGSKQISDELIYSVETYVYNRLKKTNTETFRDLIIEMMKFGISAEKYFS